MSHSTRERPTQEDLDYAARSPACSLRLEGMSVALSECTMGTPHEIKSPVTDRLTEDITPNLPQQHNGSVSTPTSFGLTIGSTPTPAKPQQFDRSRPASSGPESLGLDASEYDIELDLLTLPTTSRHYSTDRLVLPPVSPSVPPSLRSTSFEDEQPSSDESSNSKPNEAKIPLQPIPNYKPLPLRWHFFLFLFTLIASLFAFLEYQVNNLPPMNFSGLALYQPTRDEDTYQAPKLSHTNQPLTSQVSGDGPLITPPPRLRVPDPRPPEQDYPEPFVPVPTFCGWAAPEWVVKTHTAFHEDCKTRPTSCGADLYTVLAEQIPTFITEDSSWCPCRLLRDRLDDWAFGFVSREDNLFSWDTTDGGCESAMVAIQSFNDYKTLDQLFSTSAVLQLPSTFQFELYWRGIFSNITRFTTPVLFETGYPGRWHFARTDDIGNVVIPLVTRTAGTREVRDVFGNKVEPTDVALFPDQYIPNYTSVQVEDGSTEWAPNNCLLSLPTDRFGSCTETIRPSPALSTTWWVLPLSAPITSSGVLSGPTLTPTPLSSSSRSVSTPVARPTTTVWQPTSTAGSVPETTGGTKGNQEISLSSTNMISELSSTEIIPKTTFPKLLSEQPPRESSMTTNPVRQTDALETAHSTTINGQPVLGNEQTSLGTSHDLVDMSTSPSGTKESMFSTSKTEAGQDLPYQGDGTSEVPGIVVINKQLSTAYGDSIQPLASSPAGASTAYIPLTTIYPPARGPLPKGPIPPNTQAKYFNLRSESDYLMVSVVPVLLSTLLLIPIQIVTTSLNLLLPFMALTHRKGALLEDSLCLSRNPTILAAPAVAIRYWTHFNNPLPLLSALLSTVSAVLVTLSSEVIRLDLTTNCDNGIIGANYTPTRVCAVGLRKSAVIMRVAEGLLVFMGALAVVMAFLLGRRRSGVATEPWSIASMASLIRVDGELHKLLHTVPGQISSTGRQQHVGTRLKQALEGRRFCLAFSHHPESGAKGNNATTYGIEVVPTATEDDIPIKTTLRDPPKQKARSPEKGRSAPISSTAWEAIIRVIALLFTIGLLALILHYETAVGVDTAFERFMNSQTIGVRVLFTGFGIAINVFWGYYFSYTSESQIHQLLARSSQPARTSILLSPPDNVFIGLWRSRHGTKSMQDLLSFNIALAALLAKFTPIVLSNIPFSNAVTWKIHEASTWLAVAFLSHMVLVLILSFLFQAINYVRDEAREQVSLPVRPDSIAACLYYITHAEMTRDFEGLSTMGHKERDRLVSDMNKMYCMKKAASPTRTLEELRVRVDYA